MKTYLRLFIFLALFYGFSSVGFATSIDSSSIAPSGVIVGGQTYMLTYGYYSLRCGADVDSQIECDHFVSAEKCSDSYQPEAIVGLVSTDNAPDKMAGVDMDLNPEVFNWSDGYYLHFNNAKIDISDSADHGVMISYIIYCRFVPPAA